jgi:hypothetical protein
MRPVCSGLGAPRSRSQRTRQRARAAGSVTPASATKTGAWVAARQALEFDEEQAPRSRVLPFDELGTDCAQLNVHKSSSARDWIAGPTRRPPFVEGVAQTLSEAVRSFLRVGSEIGHRIRHARCVGPDVVTPTCSGGRLRDRQQHFRNGFMQQPPSEAGVNGASAETLPLKRKQASVQLGWWRAGGAVFIAALNERRAAGSHLLVPSRTMKPDEEVRNELQVGDPFKRVAPASPRARRCRGRGSP